MDINCNGVSTDLEEFLDIGEPDISFDPESISVFIGKNLDRKNFIAQYLVKFTNINHSEITRFINEINENVYYNLEYKCLEASADINNVEVGIKTFVTKIATDLPKPQILVELEHIYKGFIINVNNELIEKTFFACEHEDLGIFLVDKQNNYYRASEILFLEDITTNAMQQQHSEEVTINKKYELTDETVKFAGRTLYRIKALKDFQNVKTGDLGGFIESEENLSHEGDCWISGKAKVLNNARIIDNAWVTERAVVKDNALVSDEAFVSGFARVTDEALVSDQAWVTDRAIVENKARIAGTARVMCNALVTDNTQVIDDAWVSGKAWIKDKAIVKDNAWVTDNSIIMHNRIVGKNEEVFNNYI
jgi:carbonic anhydrase/acetyltransferase-like protein (isoleucine patch superfamily)